MIQDLVFRYINEIFLFLIHDTMKKSILFLLFWALFLPLMAQNYLAITGTVTDSITGNPVPYNPVTIQTDSTTPPFYQWGYPLGVIDRIYSGM